MPKNKVVPETLLDLTESEDTSLQIAQVCIANGAEKEIEIEEIAYRIGLVLLGKLSPETLSKTLEKDLKLSAEIAEKIYLEVNRLIFSKVKDDLAKLYQEEVPLKEIKEKPKRPSGKDVYRELTE